MAGQIVNIPDANFKTALLAAADTNNDGEIQVSEAEVVESLSVINGAIGSMEGIQSFINLTYLNCSENDYSELDLSQNVNLVELWCGRNNLTEVDLSQNINLVELHCDSTLITNLDLSHNLELVILYVSSNPFLTSLDVSQNQALERLWSVFGELTSLIIQNPNLKELTALANQLSTIDVSQNPNLEYLNIGNNNLTELDVTQNHNLEALNFRLNSVNTIDISQNPNLIQLSFSHNEISTLDLSLSPNLNWLSCSNNLLTELDFTNNPELYEVRVDGNSITELDFSVNTELYNLDCRDNQLVSLNLKNGNNAALLYCSLNNNPNLNCIQVDDPIAASNNSYWEKDALAVYSLDCALSLEVFETLQAVIYPNPVRDILTIESKENIASIEVYSMLGELIASEMGVSQIDFSSYAKGVYFLRIDTENGSVIQKIMKE